MKEQQSISAEGTPDGASLKLPGENEACFRFMAEKAKDIFFHLEYAPYPHLSYISPAVQLSTGYTPQELLDNNELIGKILSDRKKSFAPAETASEQAPLVVECEHKDGHPVWLEIYLAETLSESGEPVAVDGIARDITERELKERQLKQSYARIEALSNRVLSAMEEERSRLARDLHDQLGQILTAVKLDLQLLADELAAYLRQKERVAQSISLIDSTLQLVRRQSVSLRPPTLDNMGLVPALRDMTQGFMERTGIRTTLEARGFRDRLPLDMETALYRCVQESLTNVVRHAKAAAVQVQLKQSSEEVSICIEDNGIGFQPKKLTISPQHIGLTGMQERVRLLQGTFYLDSGPGRGTRIQIVVPRRAQNQTEVNIG